MPGFSNVIPRLATKLPGIGNVNEVAERLGGFVFIDASAENKTFKIRVCIPQNTSVGFK